MKPNYTVIIYTPQDLNHSSYIQSGLFGLENIGLIHCKVKIDISKKLGRVNTKTGKTITSSNPQQKTSYYKLIDHVANKEYYFATDLYDISHFFSQFALENCDFVFKRNYVSKDIDSLSPEFQKKVFPMGLTLGVQSIHRKYWRTLKTAHFLANLNLHLKMDRNFFKRFQKVVRFSARHRRYVTQGRSLDKLENTSNDVQLKVFYQVRCFPQINDEDVKKVHTVRSSLIRLLKKELKNEFLGGIVPGEISNKYYADCLTNLPTDPESYVALIKKSAICIYTNGLQNSPARKLAEYLSQGKCIVAQKIDAELPEPLEHGKNIMFYSNNEECISICKDLLGNPEKVKMLSKNARAYFEMHVHPLQNTKRILEHMLQKPLS